MGKLIFESRIMEENIGIEVVFIIKLLNMTQLISV